MSNPFFDHPILNSPYECPRRHWELDEAGQPTQKIIETRRSAEFITPIPKPKKRKAAAPDGACLRRRQGAFDQGAAVRSDLDHQRGARLRGRMAALAQSQPVAGDARRRRGCLQHWRHHKFSGVRPFFCQVEAVETAIWLTEVAPQSQARQARPRASGRRPTRTPIRS